MPETVQTVSRVVPVAVDRLFVILTDPSQHSKIDGSGMVRGAATAERITKVGGVFRMDMNNPVVGDYQTDNYVLELDPGRRIAWAPGRAGGTRIGHVWSWELTPQGDATSVSHSYDWSGVTDPAILARIPFPAVTAAQMARSIENLAAAAS